MIRLFKRRSPAHRATAIQIHPEDRPIARHWGYTDTEWAGLPNEVRTAKRDGFYMAAGLGA